MMVVTARVTADAVEMSHSRPVPWWSFTKTALAAAALALVARGCFGLDETLAGQRYSLRHLLQHRAGVADYGGLAAYHEAVARRDAPWPLADLLERTNAHRLISEPGTRFRYSNIGYALVRALIETASGGSLQEALRALVFEPLGVDGVSVARTPQDLDGTAWGNARGYHPGWVYHGLLIGPAASAALFLHRLLGGQLLPGPLLDAMRTAHPVAGSWPGRPWPSGGGYGLGLMIGEGEPPGLYIGHTGVGPGSTSAIYQRSPDGLRTAAVFAPLDEPGEVERRALAMAYGEGP